MLSSLFLAILVLEVAPAWGQELSSSTGTPDAGSAVTSVPGRPTLSAATDTTQCGVLELEYGLERQWPGGGANRDDLSGGLRFGLLPKLDFHWSAGDFVHLINGDGERTGFGDNWFGLKYRFLGQTKRWPSLGVFYQAKMPSASALLGLGSGKVDHSFSILASKDLDKFHLDFNVIELLAGRPTLPGLDHNTGFSLATWLPPLHRFTPVVELYGYTSLNPSTLAFASGMIGFNYKVQPRVYLDTGLDVGVTSGAPEKRVFVGITYAIGNLYSWTRSQR